MGAHGRRVDGADGSRSSALLFTAGVPYLPIQRRRRSDRAGAGPLRARLGGARNPYRTRAGSWYGSSRAGPMPWSMSRGTRHARRGDRRGLAQDDHRRDRRDKQSVSISVATGPGVRPSMSRSSALAITIVAMPGSGTAPIQRAVPPVSDWPATAAREDPAQGGAADRDLQRPTGRGWTGPGRPVWQALHRPLPGRARGRRMCRRRGCRRRQAGPPTAVPVTTVRRHRPVVRHRQLIVPARTGSLRRRTRVPSATPTWLTAARTAAGTGRR